MRENVIALSAIAALASGASASPFATSVEFFDAGSNPASGFTDAATAIGSPERFTGEGVFPSGVTPFNPAFGTDEIVSIGAGGRLDLGFDRAITDNPNHAFGVDLIVFSNAGFADASFTDADPDNDGIGLTGNNPFVFGAGGAATIQVSQNGTDWVTAETTTLDLFPTLGYQDITDPTPAAPGSVPTDFTKALDPSLTLADFANLDFAQIRALYGASGGGVGIDIASTGLESASFVRFRNDSTSAFEIDAVSVVPAPGAFACMTIALAGTTRRRRA